MRSHVVTMKLPITSCPQLHLLSHLNSFHEDMLRLNAKFDGDSLLYLHNHFDVMATQYMCSLNSVYHPH